ncbi:phosphate propanoyltransferase [Evansella clarkii]|uniref:phosphate propanoyltransferase n=1 Tax=Evansella clarkii TaxID=79879 RepID=UPI000B43EEA7|nr:phosphate propanoyltransferase [Evansella clarkii]
MNNYQVEKIVAEVIAMLNKPRSRQIPLGVSARHCHLSLEMVEKLFGEGYKLTKKSDLSQPGQFAAEETILIAGPKGSIDKVRVLGPARSVTQVEISKTDARHLGLAPPVRQSGDIKNSSPVTLIGPKGSVSIPEGLIIAQAHIHMSPSDAENFNVTDGELVEVKAAGSERSITFSNILIRVSERYRLEMHLDTDEANAGGLITGNKAELIKQESHYVR